MTVQPAAQQISYVIVATIRPEWITDHRPFRIDITYASGAVRSLGQRFREPAKAHAFIARFYPDLVGKCTFA